MKVLVLGLGSMGKRRVRNLQALEIEDIIGFDIREDRSKEAEEKYGIQTFDNFEDAVKQNPDIFIISVSPDAHIKYQLYAAQHGIHFFTELSVIDEGLEKIIELVKEKGIIGVPSSTMRFHAAINKIKELIDKNEVGKLCTFTYHSGQYLPDWHPWEKVTDYYVSNKETSGGREMVPFELTWLTWVFGQITHVYGNVSQELDHGAEIDDMYHAILNFKSGLVGSILIDVVTRYAYRTLKVLGEEGNIEWDWNEQDVKLYKSDTQEWQVYKIETLAAAEGYHSKITEEMYIKEIESFLNAVKSKAKYEYSLEEDLKIIRVLYKIEESYKKKRKLEV